MQFVPPLFFSRPGKGRTAGGGVSPGCMDGAGWQAVDRGGKEWVKKCAVAVKKIGKEFVGILKSITFAPQSPQ